MSKLVDKYGRPISTKSLRQEFAPPTLAGLQPAFSKSIVNGLNPVSMARILQDAASGAPDKFFALAEEMLERDLHYAAVIRTRINAITGVQPIVLAASKDKDDEKKADFIREIIRQPEFVDDYLTDLLDALNKGFSVVETVFERNDKEWRPSGYKWRDPRYFLIDKKDGQTLRLKDANTQEGLELPPFKFSIHRPKLKSGLPIRGGLARLAAWSFLFKSYTVKDWMAFLEVYGMPLRVGRYGQSASIEDKRILLQAVRDLSTDAAAIIPKGMDIEFVEVKGGSGNAVFGSMADYLDRQVSKGVLGQTMTTDDGSSLSQAAIHENVRFDIARADARQTAATANRDLIQPLIDLNFGPQDHYPRFILPITEAEDVKALGDSLVKLVPLGLEVSMKQVRERLGFDDPEENEILLKPNAWRDSIDKSASDGEVNSPSSQNKDKKDETARMTCPDCGTSHMARADFINDAMIEDALADWKPVMKGVLKPIETLFQSSQNYEDLLNGLERLSDNLDLAPLADHLAKAMMIARGEGDIGEGDIGDDKN